MVTALKTQDTRSRGKLPTGKWSELFDVRRRKKHKQTDAARVIGVSQSTFSGWESGCTFPGVEYAEALALYMEQSNEIVWLMILKNYLSRNIEKLDIISDMSI